jgi:PAS domain S-box-containing protein
VQRFFDDPLDLDARVQLKAWLIRFQGNGQYARVFLMDAKGAGRIFASDIAESIPRHIPLDASKALQSGKVTILDLDRDEDTPQPHMVILIPIFGEQAGNLPLGVVVMRIDPYEYLYPLVKSWPIPSASAETLIVRRDGNYALFLNELRFQKDTALSLRISLEDTQIPAVQAVLGYEGIMEGIDYRGAPVIADLQRIPDSPWFMVARVDTSEVYAPLTQMLWVIMALAGALVIGAGAGVGMVWRQQNLRQYRERLEASVELRQTQEKASATMIDLNAELEGRVLERTAQFEVANREIETAREYAESIIDTVREPLIALDQDLRVVKVSRSFYEFFRVTPEETVGQLIYDLGNKQWDIPKLRELLETILPEKASFENYEVEHTFSTIGRRIMLLNARQIQRALGKERVILLAIEDITERKEIEAGLEETRKELVVIKRSADEASEFAESVINTVREPLIALDQDLRVVKVSRSFYEFFRVTPGETVGQLFYDLGNRQWDIPGLRELLEEILPQRTTLENYEVEHTFSTIGRRIMLLNARQIQRVLGKERVILLAIEDITEKRTLERGVEKARDAAEAANAELEAFSYSVSHDLRTPLRSIDGFSQALLEDYGDALDDTAKSFLNRVRKATQQMGRLIDDLLKLSRVTRSDFHHESVDLSRVVGAIIDKLREESPERTVDVVIQEGVIVNGDPNLLKIVLENLLGNAWKFTSREALPKLEFGTTVKEGKTACFVRDNGAGFDMAYVDKLFGAFQRLHTTLEFPGTGIGLATVRRVINRHGGQVWVQAEVGKGATFYFTLPG